MMEWFYGLDLPKIVTAISIIFGLLALLLREVSRSTRRRHQLAAAAVALGDHYVAMGRLLDDPATPRFFLEAINDLADKFEDRDFARTLTAHICGQLQTSPDTTREHAARVRRELASLAETRQDLHDDFTTFVVAGSAAAILRWSDTADAMYEVMARVSSDTRKDAFASKVVAWNRPEHSRPNLVAVPA